MKREIITIDESLCDGCGECVPNCPEGAITVVDGKARLVRDIFCDGLGACIGKCPRNAITIERREAEAYDERRAMENIIGQGESAVTAHLAHLIDHGEHEYYREAINVLAEKGLQVPGSEAPSFGTKIPSFPEASEAKPRIAFEGCPGSRSLEFGRVPADAPAAPSGGSSSLTHWPVQLHLINPRAPHFARSNLLLAADCTAFSLGGFHGEYLKGRTLAIACPKLDSGKDEYIEKLTFLVDEARIETLTVMIMEVPCCGGLLEIARTALQKAARKVPLKKIVVGIQGGILSEEWV